MGVEVSFRRIHIARLYSAVQLIRSFHMQLRHLRSFVAVAEERQFGRAARRLHIAQPALSQQIKQLEAELGVQLFHRTTRRVDLAPAGEVLLERARSILAAVERAALDAQRADRGEVGTITIGFTGSATYALLPSLASALRATLPGVSVELHGEMLTPSQVEGLLDGSLDIALLRPPVHHQDLAVEVVRREPLIAVLPAHHRLAKGDVVAVGDLAADDFVVYPSDYRSVVHDAVERLCESHGFIPRAAVEASETSTMISFVAAGIGVAIVPASVAHLTVSGAVYRLLAGQVPLVELAIAWRRADNSAVVRRALEIARQSAALTSQCRLPVETGRSRTVGAQRDGFIE